MRANARMPLSTDEYCLFSGDIMAGDQIDVLLVNPPFRLHPPFRYNMIDPPRNFTIIAAWLEKAGLSVKILDAAILEMSFDEMESNIRRIAPCIVGISNRSTYNFPIVQKTARIVKGISPSIPVIVGGTYVTWAPEDALRSTPEIDCVVVGEGDYSATDLCIALLAGTPLAEVRGIAYREGDGTIQKTAPAELVRNLDDVPFPANHLLPIDRYVERKERYILSLTRGCLFTCSYCTSSYERGSFRAHSVARLMEEIGWAYDKGFRYFYFFDDIFTVDKALAGALCDAISESGMQFSWHCMTRLEYVDPPLLAQMARAGCDLIGYGVESTNADALKTLKRRNGKEPKDIFAMTREAGIRPLAFAIFGLPGATFRDEMFTLSYLLELGPDAVRDFSYKPYPGTAQFLNPRKSGIHIFNYDFSRWSQHDEPVHRTEDIDEHEIIEARVLCNYLFRTKGDLRQGRRLRRKRDAVLIRTASGGLLYNPFRPAEQRTTDFYQNCLKISSVYYEIYLRCDGYNPVDDIAEALVRLFGLNQSDAAAKVESAVKAGLQFGLLEEMPELARGTAVVVPISRDDRLLSIG